MLTAARLRELVDYDPLTGLFTWIKPTAHRVQPGDVAGSHKQRGYFGFTIDSRAYQSHRLAWLYVYGKWPEKNLDHINRNPSDNRIANLREADQSANMQNKGMQRNNKTGVTGVMFDMRRGAYRAEIRIAGKTRYLGRFNDLESAASAYAAAKAALHPFSTGANRRL
jgi:hypothetical protein